MEYCPQSNLTYPITMGVKMSFFMKFLMLTSLACSITASATIEIKAQKFKQIYVEEDSWASNEMAALDSPGRLSG